MVEDKQVRLVIGDGPEGVEIFTSEERAIVDWAKDIPARYIKVSMMDASAQFGPFTLSKTLIEQLVARLK